MKKDFVKHFGSNQNTDFNQSENISNYHQADEFRNVSQEDESKRESSHSIESSSRSMCLNENYSRSTIN